MVTAKTGCHLWVRGKPGLKARCSVCYRRIATVGTISTFGLKLVFDNGPEMMHKLTSSPATVGPSPEKVTFRPPLRGISTPEPRIFEDTSYAGRLTSKLRPGIIFYLGMGHTENIRVQAHRSKLFLPCESCLLSFMIRKTWQILRNKSAECVSFFRFQLVSHVVRLVMIAKITFPNRKVIVK